jgi:L-ascorbate metabolism protein UlaG (beta-lactamase superfamily)
MSTQNGVRYRLGDSTVVEPLINQWSVWSDLISPLPYSLHMANYQLKTLASYLEKPDIHVKACRNPKFVGGPFVDYPPERAEEIRELMVTTQREQQDNIAFANAAVEFQNLLAEQANGQSIEPFYAQTPAPLRGYVELLYDYFNHPIVRFMDNFLYRSPYYKENLQSMRLFRQESDSARRFFLSTPRLQEPDQIDWRVPFNDSRVDDLFRLDLEPQPLGRIREVLGLTEADDTRLLPLLSSAPLPPPAPRWDGAGARIRYFGHACAMIEWNGVTIMTDPWLSTLPEQPGIDRFSYRDLPETIDFALISHAHHDHFVAETLLRLRHRVKTLVVPRAFGMFYADTSLKLVAEKCGIREVIEISPLDSIPIPGGEIIGVPFFGEHADLGHAKSGYVVRTGDKQTLFAADSNCLDREVYDNLRRMIGPVQTSFLGMECVGAPITWLYGAFLPIKFQRSHEQNRRTQACNADRGEEILAALGSDRVYNYAMGSEPWLEYSMGLGNSLETPQTRESDRFLERVRAKGFTDGRRLFGKHEIHLEAR